MEIIVIIVILLFSVVVHEVSHGLVAEHLGDPTARDEGRLTLNPIPHIDPFGSILLPVFMWIATAGQFVFGAAKPVPVNYYNLRNPRRDMALVAASGPASNLLLAAASALPLRFGLISPSSAGGDFLLSVVFINVILAVFNAIPIPPLDGSKILAAFGPDSLVSWLASIERYGFLIILIFLYTGLLDIVLMPAMKFFLSLLLGS